MRLDAIVIGPKDESGVCGAPLARSGRGGWESEEEGARSRECRDALVLQKKLENDVGKSLCVKGAPIVGGRV